MDITILMDKAREAAERRNYDYAIELYLQACNLNPDSVEARRELRAVENRVFKERGISFGGKVNIGMHLIKAKCFLAVKKYESAMQSAEDILRLDPGHTGASMILGTAASHAGHVQAAIATFEDVSSAKGGGDNKVFIQASRELGRLYETQNRIQEALERWADVQKNTPGGDRESAQKSRDLSARSMSQHIETGTAGNQSGSYARRIARDNQKMDKLERSAKDIRTADDLAEAIKDTESELQTRPDDARVHGKLGDLLKQSGKYEESKRAYESAAAKDDANPHWRFKLDDLDIWKLANEYNELAKKFKAGDGSVKESERKKKGEILDLKLKSFQQRERNYATDGGIKFELGNILFDAAELRNDSALYDQAIMRFQTTFRDPKFRVESGLRMGLGFARKMQYDLALKRFDETLSGLELKDLRWKKLMYAKGDTLEKAGNGADALRIFLEIYEVDVAYQDVSKRVEALQKDQADESDTE